MGTANVQGELWGARARDWAEIGEPTTRKAWEAVFARAGVGPGTRLLDLGCGAGGAMVVARTLGAEVTGLDASAALVAIARERLPGGRVEKGDIEDLPFKDSEFDVVTGFNSLQFTGDIVAALREARRVCRPGGTVSMLVWGPKEVCETSATTIAAVAGLMPAPAPPPGAPPLSPLSEDGVVEVLMTKAGMSPVASGDVECPFLFPDAATATRAMSAAGPVAMVVRHAGADVVQRTILDSLKPFTRPDGSVLQRNRFKWVMARKP